MIVVESMNLFVGIDAPASSLHLDLSEVKLPSLQEIYQDHHPGGGLFGVEIFMGMQKLEASFKLVGYNPGVMSHFGENAKNRTYYTGRGFLRDKIKGVEVPLKAIINGRLGKVEPDTFKRGDLLHHSYNISEIFHYELWLNDAEKYYMDVATNLWRVDGVAMNASANAILGIPQAI